MATILKTPVEYAHTTKKVKISQEFGSRKELLSDADSNTEHEQEEQNAEETRDQQEGQRDSSAQINIKTAKNNKKGMECIERRCSIARMQETKTSTTCNARLKYKMCQDYNRRKKSEKK